MGGFKGLGDKEDISSAALPIRGNYFSLQPRAEGPVGTGRDAIRGRGPGDERQR